MRLLRQPTHHPLPTAGPFQDQCSRAARCTAFGHSGGGLLAPLHALGRPYWSLRRRALRHSIRLHQASTAEATAQCRGIRPTTMCTNWASWAAHPPHPIHGRAVPRPMQQSCAVYRFWPLWWRLARAAARSGQAVLVSKAQGLTARPQVAPSIPSCTSAAVAGLQRGIAL